MQANKSLGQHWLHDEPTLEAICEAANLGKGDTVLEVGPGLGGLTKQLVLRAGKVIAVELDKELAVKLSSEVKADNLETRQGDILAFDLLELPVDYKVVANIPYYLTSKLLRVLSETPNPPKLMVLLVQKEVAERIAAEPGEMSLLSVSAQLYSVPRLGPLVAAEMFEPPPKVDSQVIILRRRPKPLFPDLDSRLFFRIVKAGFAGRRKKLRGSLSAGLNISKGQADKLLADAKVNGGLRAQNLSLKQWYSLYLTYKVGLK